MRSVRIHNLIGVTALAIAFALMTAAHSAQGATIDVPQDENTIQGAVDAADPGDTVSINKAKVYAENVTVPTSNLTIRGSKGVIVDGGAPDSLDIFNITGNNVTVEGLTARHGDAINCVADGCEFEQVRVLSETDDCLNIQGDDAKVLDSTLRPCGDDFAIEIVGNDYVISGNRISQTDSSCIDVDGDDGIIRANKIHNCEDADGVESDGNDLLFEDNRIASMDEIGLDHTGDDAQILNNLVENSESDCFEIDGDRNLVKGNRTEGCYDHSFDVDGDRMEVIGNSAFAGATDDDCFLLNGLNPVVQNNRADLCDGGWEIDGENPKVVGNKGTRLGDDDGFDVDCSDTAGGAPAAEACSDGIVRRNSASDNNNDDEGFDISVFDGHGVGFEISQNTSKNNNDGGFQIVADGAVVKDNVSRNDGSEGNEPAFELEGDALKAIGNTAIGSAEDGFQVDPGIDIELRGNVAKQNLYDGFNLAATTDALLVGNEAIGNHGDGFDTGGTNTTVKKNVSSGNGRVDCGSDGTIAAEQNNECADGSDFDEPGGIDSRRRR